MPVFIKKRLSKRTAKKAMELRGDRSYRGITFNPRKEKFYKTVTRKGELQTLGDRTKVSKVWDIERYRESVNIRRFSKPHGVKGGDKPTKIVTKLYGEKGKFRDKRVIKPQVPTKKRKK